MFNKFNILNRKTIIFIVTMFLFFFCFYVFYPGWMSPDSMAQYTDAKSGVYSDWHPVFMAWWWSVLLHVWDGPQPVLIQNLLFYWGAWFLLGLWVDRRLKWFGILVPLIGLWPGISYVLGQIWKDVWFAVPMFFSWALLLNIKDSGNSPSWIDRILLIVSLVFSIGVKPNGITALPFVVYYWMLLEKRWGQRFHIRIVARTLAVSIAIVLIPSFIYSFLEIGKAHGFQYTQTYDILAISVGTGKNLLPEYLNDKLNENEIDYTKLYFIGGNNLFFYNSIGNIGSYNDKHLSELNDAWIKSILNHPFIYLEHRFNNFLSLMRIGYRVAASTVAHPVVVDNDFGISIKPNSMSKWLSHTPEKYPLMYFPWIYLVVTAIAGIISFRKSSGFHEFALISASSISFMAPHFFIAPASDYRYLYYSYICAIFLLMMSIFEKRELKPGSNFKRSID